MALTFTESAALMNDPDFRGRVKVAALNYAQFLSLQTGNNNSKMKWIQQTQLQPDMTATILVPPTVMNPNVQAGGATVSDADLQAAVQATADMIM